MKKLLLFLLPLSFMVTSCGQKVDPVEFNDKLVRYSMDAEKSISNLDDKLEVFFGSEKFTAETFAPLSVSIKKAKDSIESTLDKIKALEIPKGGEAFQNTTIAYIETLIAETNLYSEQYAKITDDISDEELVKMDEVINNALANSDKKLEEMEKTQIEFAKANNIELVMKAPGNFN